MYIDNSNRIIRREIMTLGDEFDIISIDLIDTERIHHIISIGTPCFIILYLLYF